MRSEFVARFNQYDECQSNSIEKNFKCIMDFYLNYGDSDLNIVNRFPLKAMSGKVQNVSVLPS